MQRFLTRRNAVIAGVIAALLVVAGGVAVFATSALSSPESALTPTSVATPTTSTGIPSPTPSPSPTPTTVAPAVAFDGDCAAVLSEDAVSSIVGVPMALSNGVSAADAAVLGGVRCQWMTTADGYQAVGVAVYPWGAVPEAVRSQVGIVPDCIDVPYACQFVDRFGDATVMAWGATVGEVTALTAEVGGSADLSPGVARTLPAESWAVPECSEIRDAVERARGGGDIVDHRGDYYPHGFDWEVLSTGGAAAYCAVDNLSAPAGTTPVVDFDFGPGSSPPVEQISQRGGVPVIVAGADAAWYLPDFTTSASLLVVQSGPNTLTVGTESMTQDEMGEAAAAVIAALG